MKIKIYSEKVHGNYAFVLYSGRKFVLYNMDFENSIDSLLQTTSKGFSDKGLLSLETGEFLKRYMYRMTLEVSDED